MCSFIENQPGRRQRVRRRERCVPPNDEDSEFPSHDTLNRGLSYCTGSGVWLLLIKDGLTLTSQRRFSGSLSG